ncbi:MAG: YIP1 family protein [Bacteroidales bacterium]|nr:YIP1 family protein [Bacteroidales bacterium]
MSETSSFDFNAFIQESKETLLNPKSYFPTMKLSGGMAEPLIKAVIYGAVAGILAFLWGVLGLGGVAGIFGAGIGAMALVWTIVGALIGLFIGAVILLIISSICKGNADFEANMRVTAAVMVVMPINALLGFTMGINSVFGMIISLGVNLYALYLLYHGLTGALKANPGTAKIVMYVLAALLLIATLAGLSTRNKMNRIMNDINMDQSMNIKEDSR